MVQEYGRYFGMSTCCLRGGCLTGPSHSGVELHGFLSYLVKCNLEEKIYNIFGYKGKQVRDNIHSEDVAQFIDLFLQSPRSGEVYNLGGGKENSCSILEAIRNCSHSGISQKYEYQEGNRIGDHICYYSDLTKIKSHYPSFSLRHSLSDTIKQIVEALTSILVTFLGLSFSKVLLITETPPGTPNGFGVTLDCMFKKLHTLWFTTIQRSKHLAISSDIYWLRCPIIHQVVFFSLFWLGRFRMEGRYSSSWLKNNLSEKFSSVYAFVYSPECMNYASWIAKKEKYH